jgi:hypothetical protein
MPYPTTLDNSPALTVTGLSLQLKVRHACGTCHAYVVRFDITDESGVESQLNEDLGHLIELMRERANYGEYEVNNRKYFAIEIPDTNDAVTRMLSDEMPVIVLPSREQESQSVASNEEAEREPDKAQTESESQLNPATNTPSADETQQVDPVSTSSAPPAPEEQLPSLKESNQQLEEELNHKDERENKEWWQHTAPPVSDIKDEQAKTTANPEPEQKAAEEHKLAAQEHDMAAQEHRLAEGQKQDEQKQETTTDELVSGLPFLSRKGRRGRGK